MQGDRAAARPSVEAPVVVVTGATGQIGFELVRELAPLGTVLAPSRSELDLERPETIRALVRRVRPSVIVNAAAYTAVDKAESDRQRCFAVNAEAPGIFAEEAARVGAALIHYSTDYVFDGTKTSPYVETDTPAPLNVYGESKLAGERAIESVGGAWMVLRTSWVYGMRGNNFLRTILRRAREQRELRVVDDQMGAPTWSTSVAKATAHVISTASAGPRFANGNDAPPVAGVYHLSSVGHTSWYGFAQAIAARVTESEMPAATRLIPVHTEARPTPAARPRWSVLSGDKFFKRFGVRLASWETELETAIASNASGREPTGR